MAKLPPDSLTYFLDSAASDPRFAELLEDIEREDTPERLLALAHELQEKMLERKRRGTAH